MAGIQTLEQLQAAIKLQEQEQVINKELLRKQVAIFYESIKPVNLIRSAFQQAVASPHIKSRLLKAALGISAGYLAKNLIQSLRSNPLAKTAGSLLSGVFKASGNNASISKSIVNCFLKASAETG